MIIYLITNMINGNQYVGQTTRTLNERWIQHCNKSSSCRRLKNAINKYGKENFKVEIIENCKTLDELNAREKYWIKTLNTLSPNGYNLLTGGNNSLASDETKKLLSEKRKGENNSFYGKKHTNDTRKIMSNKHYDCKGSNNPMYNKKRTDEEIYKIKSTMGNLKLIYCYENKKTYLSLKKVSEDLNVDSSQVAKVCKNILNSAKGFHFTYVDLKSMEV